MSAPLVPDEVITVSRQKLLSHQWRFLHSVARLVMLTGGLGCGKTFTLVWWALERALACWPLPVWLFEPTFPMVRRILIPAFEEITDRHGIPMQYRSSDHRVLVELDGRELVIPCLSASNPDHIKGPNLACAGVDEAGQVQTASLKHIRARCRHVRASPIILDPSGRRVANVDWIPGSIIQVGLTGTPEGCHGYFWEAATGQTPKMARALATGRAERIKASTYDNDQLDPDYVEEELADFDEYERELFVFGEFVPPRGRVYTHFKRDRHVRAFPLGEMRSWQWGMGCDFNVDPMTFILFAYNGAGENFTAWAIDELVRGPTTSYEHAEEAAARWTELLRDEWWTPPRHEIAGKVLTAVDASGRARTTQTHMTDVDALKKVGFRVRSAPVNPLVRDRVFTMQHLLRHGRFLVDPRCKTLIHAMENQQRAKDGEPDKAHGLDHAPDAAGYFAFALAPRLRPTPNGRKSPSTSYR